MAGNGQNDHESRLNRLEAYFDFAIRDNEEFRERLRRSQESHERFKEETEKEHKRLLIAQVVLQDNMEKMQVNLESTRSLVHEIGDKLNALITWSDQVHRDNNERFKRLEEKH
jgi:hypothetical protein